MVRGKRTWPLFPTHSLDPTNQSPPNLAAFVVESVGQPSTVKPVQRPPLGAKCRQVVSIHRFRTLMQSDIHSGRGWLGAKVQIINSVPKRNWREFSSVWALLGLPLNFGREAPVVKDNGQMPVRIDAVCHTVAARRETGQWNTKNLVVCWATQVAVIRIALSVWNCPCTKKW